MKQAPKIQSVERYVTGTNELLDRINDGKTVWIVQGSAGRRPVIADTEEAAREKYIGKKRPIVEED